MDTKKLEKIEITLLDLYCEIRANKLAKDDELEETFFKMTNTMFDLSCNLLSFLESNTEISVNPKKD
jgi:hypothetical protein